MNFKDKERILLEYREEEQITQKREKKPRVTSNFYKVTINAIG